MQNPPQKYLDEYELLSLKVRMTNFLPNKIIFCVILSAFSVSSSLNVHSYAIKMDDFVYPVDSNPFGRQFKEWLVDWWKFNLGIPNEDHPFPGDAYTSHNNAKDPSKCFIGEDKVNNVLFLGAAPVEKEPQTIDRKCNVPAGKSIFLAFATGESDTAIKPKDQIWNDATMGSLGVKAGVSLDGVKLDYQVEKNRVTTDWFIIMYNNTVFGSPQFLNNSGKYQALADGYNIFLKPLPVGNHTLSYDVKRLYILDRNLDYPTQNMTYNLIVK